MTLLMAGPCLSIGSMRARYFSVMACAVYRPEAIALCRSVTVISSSSNDAPWGPALPAGADNAPREYPNEICGARLPPRRRARSPLEISGAPEPRKPRQRQASPTNPRAVGSLIPQGLVFHLRSSLDRLGRTHITPSTHLAQLFTGRLTIPIPVAVFKVKLSNRARVESILLRVAAFYKMRTS